MEKAVSIRRLSKFRNCSDLRMHVGPRERVGNKGGTLGNKLRAGGEEIAS